ncbi:MAG: CDP-alcohol phosphatidyltransferase family protein [Bryobacterales bacterium]|nr:CDP-alcohol phosphatidyltransferase family protein [Bryobacterales bacterium]
MSALPNLLTLARIALTPYVAWLMAAGHARAGLYWLIAVGLTDILDGFLARRFGWTSAAGAYLDPVADKVLAVSVFLALGFARAIPWWLVGIVLGRDVLILLVAGLFLAFTRVRGFVPSIWGKLSTFCQLTTAGFGIGNLAYPELGVGWIVNALVWVAAAATLWSGVHYLWRALENRGHRGQTGRSPVS